MFKGVAFFTIFIIPTFYMTYVKKIDYDRLEPEEPTVDKAVIAEDNYATILKQIKDKEQLAS